jgi:CHAT domain-containing protein
MTARLAAEPEVRRLVHDVLFELRRAALGPDAARAATPEPTEALAELASLVLWPLLARAGRLPQVLSIVPAGLLGRVPWAALPLPDGRPLCSATQVVLVPGLRLGFPRRAPRPARGAPLVVGVADGGLARVAAELDAVAAALPGADVLAGPEATAERFLRLAARAPWVHFAGHGVFESGRSGLRLHDRWILAEELDGLELAARGVALSACQTARALVRPGEEWFGLPRSLLLAGAGAVLAAQWEVGDSAAARFMADVYGRLGRGASLGEAVASTQAEAAARGSHAIDWAGFVVLGGPQAAAVMPSALRGPAEA